MQAQDYGPAKWSLGQRLQGASDAQIEQAFANGAILRTHVLRPTWHFVSPADIRWLLALTSPRIHALNAYYQRMLGLDADLFRRCLNVLTIALQGGNSRARRELAAAFAEAGIVLSAQGTGYVLGYAELESLICSGPLKGKQHTYTLLEERAPKARSLTREEALAELTLRYFSSHGPASAKDFQWWSSLSAAAVKKGLTMVSPHLEHEEVNGIELWFAPSGSATPQPASPMVHLLYGLDEYIVGYAESRLFLDLSGEARRRGQQGAFFYGIVLVDGQVAGHWRRAPDRDSIRLEASLYKQFSAQDNRAALETAGDVYSKFSGQQVTVTTAVI
jgi:hypothetical protein